MKKVIVTLVMGVVISAAWLVSAKSYSTSYPEYVPVSGGAWCEINSSQGQACIVLPGNYILDTFGFAGSGDNICNLTASTVNGTLYSSGRFSWYGEPESVQCRFTRMGTLEVYAPYRNNYGTSYQWESLDISSILGTNIALTDSAGDRANSAYAYDTTDKILIVLLVVSVGGLLYRLFRRGWQA